MSLTLYNFLSKYRTETKSDNRDRQTSHYMLTVSLNRAACFPSVVFGSSIVSETNSLNWRNLNGSVYKIKTVTTQNKQGAGEVAQWVGK